MSPADFTSVSNTQLYRLGALLLGERSSLSPLLPALEGQQREDAKRSLQGCTILNAQGEIDDRFRHTMTLLSAASRVISLDMFFPDRHVLISRYFSSDGSVTVRQYEKTGDNSEIFEHISSQDILTGFGFSDNEINPQISPLDIRLSFEDAALFAALLDEERASVIASLAGSSHDDSTIPSCKHSVQSVTRIISGFVSGEGEFPNQKIIADITSQSVSLTSPKIPPAFSRLLSKGVVIQSGNDYVLADAILAMVKRLVLTDFVMNVSIQQDPGETPFIREEAYCMRADGALFWFIVRSGAPDNVSIRGMPAGILDGFTNQLMTLPAYSLATIESMTLSVQDAGSSSSQLPAKKFCPSCGVPLKAGAKFCNTCGAKLS